MSGFWGEPSGFRGNKPRSNGEPKPLLVPSKRDGWITEHQYQPAHLAGAVAVARVVLQRKFPGQILLFAAQLVEVARIPRPGREATYAPGIAPLTVATLRARLSEAIGFKTYDSRKNQWIERAVPTDVVAAILDDPFNSEAPALAAVTALPMIRADGSLHIEHGFDANTGVYLFEPPAMPAIPEQPTQAQASDALRVLIELLAGFPFDGNLSLAVALSALLTAVARPAIDGAVPMHLTTSPEPGSGKSYFADCVAMLGTGESAYATAASVKDEETEKRLVGQLLAGMPMIVLDNWNATIGGDALAQATSMDALSLRPLGSSQHKLISNKVMILVNGLNPVLQSKEFERRTLHTRLDANSETPWMLTHATKPKAELAAERGRFVAAALTVIRFGLQAAPTPAQTCEGFADWDRMVRTPLLGLGQPDPLDSQANLTVRTAESTTRAELFEAALAELNDWNTAGEILAAARQTFPLQTMLMRPRLAAALAEIGDGKGALPTKQRITVWLTKNKDRIVHEIKLLTRQQAHKNTTQYKFEATLRREVT